MSPSWGAHSTRMLRKVRPTMSSRRPRTTISTSGSSGMVSHHSGVLSCTGAPGKVWRSSPGFATRSRLQKGYKRHEVCVHRWHRWRGYLKKTTLLYLACVYEGEGWNPHQRPEDEVSAAAPKRHDS